MRAGTLAGRGGRPARDSFVFLGRGPVRTTPWHRPWPEVVSWPRDGRPGPPGRRL